MTRSRFKRLAQRMRVPLGFILVPAFVLLARPSWATVAGGAAVAGAGILIRGWASGHLRKMQTLTTSGPYAYTRNPLYFGSFLMLVGLSAAAGSLWVMGLAAGAFLFVYVPVMLAEVETMRELFPVEYDEWAAHVPLFFPRLTPAGARLPDGARFDSRLYMSYREYRAALGLLGVLGALIAKLVLQG